MYNAGESQGMTFWAPNINIFRDPRWGRGQETPGEDPLVAGKYSVAYVRGIEGDSFEGGKPKDILQASACCKHFTAYDLDKWEGVDRYIFDAQVTLQDLADTFEPPFQTCIQEGRASVLMCSYNRVNGVPNCANYDLLSKTARGEWQFDGYVAADCGALSFIHDIQNYTKLPEGTVADVLKAGTDLDCGTFLLNYTKSAVKQKKVDYVVLIMGLDQAQEREELDRVHINLPGKQEELIKSVAEASKKPVILVILSGSPVDISSAKYNNKVGSILWAGYPGEAGGTAIAEIIFGDHNPGGRLPVTWYPADFIKVPMTDMRMRPDPSSGYPGRTSRFYTGKKVEGSDTIPYKMVSELGTKLCQKMSASVTVGVRNEGDMVGKHPILLFVMPKENRKGNPLKQLVAFQSVKLNAGARAEVEFTLSTCEHLSRANDAGLKVIEEGSYFLLVGDKEYQIDIIV
ncbi:Glycoside hydrolase [Quillaja saponaria]|uniref:Glycoside hydrolase n=1 Tax=Quillaja saponaria TaxID=32244 RepID=A0AAD7PSX5_QUISA|nr:Glycoside hydrolase [Quillaja saponaria]